MISIQNVATSLHDVLLEQVIDKMIISVLEGACKVAKAVELPLDSA